VITARCDNSKKRVVCLGRGLPALRTAFARTLVVMSDRDTPPARKRVTPRRTARWRAIGWLPASHTGVWLAATAIWTLVAMLNAALGWPMIRTLAPALLLLAVGAAESYRLRRRASVGA
jgi:sterol desaturase/sphingolipid hydroxylase (fatty acid hydroxylase superfamily)